MNKEETNKFSIIHISNHQYALIDSLKRHIDFFVFRNVDKTVKNNVYAVIARVILDNLGNNSLLPTIVMNKNGNFEKLVETKADITISPAQKNIIIDNQIMEVVHYDFLNSSLKTRIFKNIVSLVTESSDKERKPLQRFMCVINDNPRYNTVIFAKSLSSATAKATMLAESVPDAKSISVYYK